MTKPLHTIQAEHKKAKLIIFDLDGTLTPSKNALDSEMAELIKRLLEIKLVAIIGGGGYKQFQKQFLVNLNASEALLKNLFLFPTTAASFYRRVDRNWQKIYAEKLTAEEKKRIFEAFEKTFNELGYKHPEKTYGELIEDRDMQITFSALGQKAPVELKEKWKREHLIDKLRIAEKVQEHLPELEVRAAGYTSIDVTKKGIDKEYGIYQMRKQLEIDLSDMIFVGDALFPNGNDYAALKTGVPCFEVAGPEDTKKIIKFLLEAKV